MPLVPLQNRWMSFAKDYRRYLIGAYRHEPVLVDPQELRSSWHDGLMPSCAPFRDDLFAPSMGYASELYPPLESAEVVEKLNGMFSFTPAGHALIGARRDERGFRPREGAWFAHGV